MKKQKLNGMKNETKEEWCSVMNRGVLSLNPGSCCVLMDSKALLIRLQSDTLAWIHSDIGGQQLNRKFMIKYILQTKAT